MFERFAASAGPYAEEPIDILLKHIVIQSWTSFEALAEDLIMDAIDAHPSLFASVQKEKLHFSSRDRIRAAYESSFTDDDASILSLINDQSIDALSVVRNLLIHSAGAVDKKFLAEAARYQTLTKFRALNIGESIQLDGINVRILVDGIVKNGCQLVRSIDCWIKAHK
jgi:hypothetical protein